MRIRSLALPLLSAIALVLALFSIARTQPRRIASDPPSAPPVSPYLTTIAAVGLVEASSENICIGSHLTGIVDHVAVTVGAHVRRGDLLFALDARHLDAEIASRQALLGEAQRHAETERVAAADARAR